MIAFFLAVAALIVGYLVYGAFVERVFGPDPERITPAKRCHDGVDFIEMPAWKVFLVQLLDIAGIGPIFGPILGALYGPIALLWIVIGTIFAGGVHDYFSGMLSVRHDGASIPHVVGSEMGAKARGVVQLFSIVLLVLVGVVFVLAPAKLLSALLGGSTLIFTCAIFIYYFVATILPIDKLIGRLYPVFGALLLFMTFGVAIGFFASGREMLPHLGSMATAHPEALPAWPLLFVTLSCGAISGFHSTQSPLMARCISNEKYGRRVFYGSMVVEGMIALIWCSVGLSFYEGPEALGAVVKSGSPSAVVNEVSRALLGSVGGLVAILGVIVLPITSGDTAFRSTRLIIAEMIGLPQQQAMKRLLLAVPLFALGAVIATVDFSIIWRYFGWSNQVLSTLMLWTAAIWLVKQRSFHWIASLPATFMTAVSVTYILLAKIGFSLSYDVSVTVGIVVAVGALGALIRWSFVTGDGH